MMVSPPPPSAGASPPLQRIWLVPQIPNSHTPAFANEVIERDMAPPTSASGCPPSTISLGRVLRDSTNIHPSHVCPRPGARGGESYDASHRSFIDPAHISFHSRVVSRSHATLVWDAYGQCWIRDQGSSHGTYVNGHRLRDIRAHKGSIAQRLHNGDLLELGNGAFAVNGANHQVPEVKLRIAFDQRQADMWIAAWQRHRFPRPRLQITPRAAARREARALRTAPPLSQVPRHWQRRWTGWAKRIPVDAIDEGGLEEKQAPPQIRQSEETHCHDHLTDTEGMYTSDTHDGLGASSEFNTTAFQDKSDAEAMFRAQLPATRPLVEQMIDNSATLTERPLATASASTAPSAMTVSNTSLTLPPDTLPTSTTMGVNAPAREPAMPLLSPLLPMPVPVQRPHTHGRKRRLESPEPMDIDPPELVGPDKAHAQDTPVLPPSVHKKSGAKTSRRSRRHSTAADHFVGIPLPHPDHTSSARVRHHRRTEQGEQRKRRRTLPPGLPSSEGRQHGPALNQPHGERAHDGAQRQQIERQQIERQRAERHRAERHRVERYRVERLHAEHQRAERQRATRLISPPFPVPVVSAFLPRGRDALDRKTSSLKAPRPM